MLFVHASLFHITKNQEPDKLQRPQVTDIALLFPRKSHERDIYFDIYFLHYNST